MKKIAIFGLFLLPLITLGATQAIKEYKTWQNFATLNLSQSNNANFYRIEDSEKSVDCYVAVSYAYTDKSYVSGISCVNSVVKK